MQSTNYPFKSGTNFIKPVDVNPFPTTMYYVQPCLRYICNINPEYTTQAVFKDP